LTGTVINVFTILLGGTFGLVFGARLPERIRQTIVAGLGLFVFAIGMQMFLKTQNSIIVLISLLIGGLLGEWWQIEEMLKSVGAFFERHFAGQAAFDDVTGRDESWQTNQANRFVRGFLTSSLVFCIGPIAILGSIQDGLTGDYKLLAIKAILDGFASLAFASSLGVGVLFSSVMILIYQGGISLLAAQAQALVNPAMMNEFTATGGVLLLAIAISSLLEIKPIRAGNFLPALLLSPLIVAVLQLLKLA
jgi:uncharacterized membrane protein YqgA involved in biofilm formation